MLSKPETILVNKLADEINNRATILAQGGAKDYSEYKENVGFLDGLKFAMLLVDEINKEITGGQK